MNKRSGWPEDVRVWLRDLSPPGAADSALDGATGVRVQAAVRAAYAAGVAHGREQGSREAFETIKQRLREEVVPPLTVVLGWLEVLQTRCQPALRAGARLRDALLRLRAAVGDGEVVAETSLGHVAVRSALAPVSERDVTLRRVKRRGTQVSSTVRRV